MLTERGPEVADGRGVELDELDAWLVVQALVVIEWQPQLAARTLTRDELVRVRALQRRVVPLLPALDDDDAPADGVPAHAPAGASS
jgi:hypothetical protein